MQFIKLIYSYFVLINILTFVFYGVDKYKATKNQYRISEFFLLLLVVIGGFLGSAFGMLLFKHKLSKKKFIITIIIATIFYILLIGAYVFNLKPF
ncbi:DUF1294 domain-containing protein [Miniphocaeibacter halophilus]|uniref:DUF1294 domain-containing protein n=1 Tax=Miniphocaeibacter halophilus TaxID=2931922 RepID=A0AC61MS22_9FIRM|nr:DUF1294 domain-containing protein [Miniphocaeibacter halophilus]QQK08480.1 DUF1294 domain-containing protein [Miniphocaeibacter halophilus]